MLSWKSTPSASSALLIELLNLFRPNNTSLITLVSPLDNFISAVSVLRLPLIRLKLLIALREISVMLLSLREVNSVASNYAISVFILPDF